MNDKQITTIICIGLLGFFLMMSIIAASNAKFRFEIDEGTEKAINDLSSFSDEPFNIEVNNYYTNTTTCEDLDKNACMKGCYNAFYNIAGSKNTICIDDFCSRDCEDICLQFSKDVK
ncbi:MAG: hypothetical protein DRI46_12685 [Chloroflexi bacterium]|nr:MAG: hypothetical protein DRI46_12685 [Chloroflexota bacterium]